MMIAPEILKEAARWRHEFHAHPECGNYEVWTSARIREILAEFPNLEILEPYLQTDVVAILHGNRPGKNLTIRADIDALPLQEETNEQYRSEKPGVMHACGHDAHISMLLGAAKILCERGTDFPGSIRFLFQPGEESIHLAGEMVKAGALDNPKADLVTALHGMPGGKRGVLYTKAGATDAATAHFEVVFTGKGGHSSRPHQAIDPIVCAAAFITNVQTIVSRRIDAEKTAVISICSIHGGAASNVIPEDVKLMGTARTLNPDVEVFMEEEISLYAKNIAELYHCKYKIVYDRGYPVLENDKKSFEYVRSVIQNKLGEDKYHLLELPSMGADDFAYYAKKSPSVYVKLGLGEDFPPLHNCHFNFPDDIMETGIAYYIALAEDFLKD